MREYQPKTAHGDGPATQPKDQSKVGPQYEARYSQGLKRANLPKPKGTAKKVRGK